MVRSNQPLLFLSFLDPNYSRSGVYLNGIRNEEIEFLNIRNNITGMIADLVKVRKDDAYSNCVVVVMSPCHKMTIFARLFLKQKLILDAGWSLSESTIAHRSGLKSYFHIARDFAIDFLAFKSAAKVVLESSQQVGYISKRFLVKRKKLDFLYTGLNERAFHSSKPNSNKHKRNERLQVLFRGKLNSEAGIEHIAEATLLLKNEPIDFIIQTNSILNGITFSSNTKIVYDFISNSEMASLYSKSDVCLGQFSSKSRLKRTIPHKAFESLYFSRCYVTPFSSPLNYLDSGTNSMYFTNGNTPEAIATALVEIERDRSLATNIGQNGHQKYNLALSQSQLALKFVSICCD